MIICKRCGQQTVGGNFCEHCGSMLDEERQFNGFGTKGKFILGFVVLFSSLLAIWMNLINYVSWQGTVDNYLQNLQKQNYEVAYKDVSNSKGNPVNKKAFIAWQYYLTQKDGDISQYRIGKIYRQNSELLVNLKVQKRGAKDENLTLKLKNVGILKFLWPNWKVVLDKDVKVFNLEFEGAKIFVDGVDTGLKSKYGEPLEVKVFAGEHYYSVQAHNAETYIVTSDFGIGITHLYPDKKILEAILKDAASKSDLVMAAYNNNNPGLVESVFGKKAVLDVTEQINNVKNQYPHLDSVEKSPTSFDSQLLSPNELMVNLEFYFNCDYVKGGAKTKNIYKLYITHIHYQQIDGKWVLKDS